MELNLVLEQLRQLKAADQSALDIYTDLLSKVEDKTLWGALKRLIRDETKHVAMDREILAILRHEGKVLFCGAKKNGEEIQKILAKSGISLTLRDPACLMSLQSEVRRYDLVILDLDAHKSSGDRGVLVNIIKRIRKGRKRVIAVSSRRDFDLIAAAYEAGTVDFILRPFNHREFTARVLAVMKDKKRICCLGGGTGLFTLLSSLKALPDVLLTSVVNMSDDGGSSGRLRISMGVLPPGDVRRSLVALSNAPEIMNEIIRYRFERRGELGDHSVGNLLLTALSGIRGSMAEAVRAMGDILSIQGIVIPITRTLTDLVARFENGKVIRGESRIGSAAGRDPNLRIRRVWHTPNAQCDASAYASILHSDIVIIGPGDLYTSVITNLVIKRIKEAVALTRAKKLYICNLMTRPGETSGLDAREHIQRINESLEGDFLDHVLVSNTRFSKAALKRYAKLDQYPVTIGPERPLQDITKARIVLADVADQKELVRHNPEKLRSQLALLVA